MDFKLRGREIQRQRTLEKAIRACTDMNGGMTAIEIAKRYKVSRARVYQWMDLVIQYGHEKLHNN